MRILLDAHALIWWLDDDPRLSTPARRAIEKAEDALVGAGSLVEIAIKQSLGKLDTNASWFDEAQANDIALLAVSWSHAKGLQSLPCLRTAGREHRDPFDRLLAAQALADRIPIVTRDPALSAYGVATIW
ncbi:MAG TPA: type II toxin-antitoxin system VapC family toxin [Solirubrobacteraceae bacterium]|jgi:PIN domain nuclease of toxin-antitoxin system|nr:type II toxin-antitoxin system VapC family toxin [Solirubrobacteraceae bacterium]